MTVRIDRIAKATLLGLALLLPAALAGERKPGEGQVKPSREVDCGEQCKSPCAGACRPILWEGEDCQQCLRDLQKCKADCEAAKKKDAGS